MEIGIHANSLACARLRCPGAIFQPQMFLSNSNGNNPISYPDQTILHAPFITDVSHNSQQEDPPSSFFYFPSPFIHYEDDAFLQHNDLIPQLQALMPGDTLADTMVNMVNSNKNSNELIGDRKQSNSVTEPIMQKRSSKRDRHSKINTARGPRDRRMRLSLEIARKFFDLQDMLGFDKASKTVEWLLIKAKSAIKELSRGGSISKGKRSKCLTKERKTRQSRKNAFQPLARESREKARARARERTREKMWSRRLDESKVCAEANSHDLNHLGSISSFETGEESGSQSHNLIPSLELLPEVEEPSSNEQHHSGITEAMLDNSLVIMSKQWSPSSIFNYLNFGISQEPQFPGFQFHGKPWEAHSNQNLC
ncbi:unnamed protein product, partial [Vitis vinifera]|uniref:Transcription factor CYCLOIDEA n=1 Tax=Vitis vinifera TaxID=29760 RepID=D7SIV0_VITVI